MKRVFILAAAAAVLIACGWMNEATAGRGTLKSRVSFASRRRIRGTATITTRHGVCPSPWLCRRRPKARRIGAGASAPLALRRFSTSSSAIIPGQACTTARGSARHRLGLPAPTNSAITTSAARGKPVAPCGGNDSVLLCQPGQPDRRAVLFTFLEASRARRDPVDECRQSLVTSCAIQGRMVVSPRIG